jgi:hypothetical protein
MAMGHAMTLGGRVMCFERRVGLVMKKSRVYRKDCNVRICVRMTNGSGPGASMSQCSLGGMQIADVEGAMPLVHPTVIVWVLKTKISALGLTPISTRLF